MFIIFEGPDGCGKTSVMHKVHTEILKKMPTCIFTRDPGGTDIGNKIRSILLNPNFNDMNNATELLLYLASRSQLLYEVINPALLRGDIVLCDRFDISTNVYQGAIRGFNKSTLQYLSSIIFSVVPDFFVFLDVDSEVGLKRSYKACADIGGEDRWENEGLACHKKIREAYKAEYKLLGTTQKMLINTTDKSMDIIVSEVLNQFKQWGIIND